MEVARSGRALQRRDALAGHHVDAGAVLQQELHRRELTVPGREVERGKARLGVKHVDLGPLVAQQVPEDLDVALSRRPPELLLVVADDEGRRRHERILVSQGSQSDQAAQEEHRDGARGRAGREGGPWPRPLGRLQAASDLVL